MRDNERNKRLGQYFTSKELAKVLLEIALKVNPEIASAIDPMMGKGDILSAVNEADNSISTYGIELDKQLKNQLTSKFKIKNKIIFGNTFEKSSLEKLEKRKFDLVITNPPYVRHLNQKQETQFQEFTAPSNLQIRNELINSLEENQSLKKDEKNFLVNVARNYSGLSDLSVPSIIQCAALTEDNGVLALIIPESCINREYSIATLLVLFKLFNVKVIVKDEERKWFKDAQVKTLLLIGQKLKQPRKSLDTHPKISIIEISGATAKSPLGDSYCSDNYKLFASTTLENDSPFDSSKGISQYFGTAHSYLSRIISKNSAKRFPELHAIIETIDGKHSSLDARLEPFIDYSNFVKLEDLPIEINQGLRTGANDFFYYDLVSEKNKHSKIYFSLKDEERQIMVPKDCLQPVLRKQKEIPNGYSISTASLKGRLLVLKNHYTSKDILKFHLKGKDIKKIPSQLNQHIDRCESLNIGTDISPKYFPELSAVRTNISEKNGIIKTWYQLPELKKRHIPEICIPRINSKSVRAYKVDKDIVVDANFLTISLSLNSNSSIYELIALLNSDWIKVQLELSGNVFGGGALKLDRNHLLNLLVPKFSKADLVKLDKLGRKLVFSRNFEFTLSKINVLVNSILNISNETFLTTLLEERLKSRCNNG